MTTKHWTSLALYKVLLAQGTPTRDGRLILDLDATVGALVQLDIFAPAPKPGQGDDGGDDGADQTAGEAREEGRERGRKERAQRERSADIWRR